MRLCSSGISDQNFPLATWTPEGDADDLLMAVYYLLHHQLISRGDFAGLVDETIAAVGDRTPNPAAVRDFLEAAHNYCIWRMTWTRT